MSNKRLIQIFGEVLFDHFPDGGRVLGGAPFNVAWHLQAFGLSPRFISRIGEDASGREIAALMDAWGMNRQGLQTDPEHPTGSVQVCFEDGEPHYDIVAGSAYDFIDASLLGEQSGLGILYHGSLALRNPVAREALQVIKARHQGKIFVDVNLRPPWWDRELLLSLLHDADWVKLNEAELAALNPDGTDLESTMQSVCEEFDLETLVVTRGGQGAMACDRQRHLFAVRPQADVEVVDTVGAGDAFAAVLLMGLSERWPLAAMLERAQAFASAMVGKRGATVADRSFYQAISRQWR
ncbi:MAG: carbohydrate kinase family protein [Methylomonas sp.]